MSMTLLLGALLVGLMTQPAAAFRKTLSDSGDCDWENFNWEEARGSWPECAKCEIWGVGVPCVRQDKERPENCNGSGMRYCVEAHKAEICPEPCQKQVP
jgi:hypothetical protein